MNQLVLPRAKQLSHIWAYIERVKKNDIATIVKIKDLEDNILRPGRDSLKVRYRTALAILQEE